MHRPFFLAVSALGAATSHAGDLTVEEMQWLRNSMPVLTFAREQRLPLDVDFELHVKPGDPPLSMGFVGQRCKLVFAIRGNPDADAMLAQIEPGLQGAVVEAMVAHELGHCWRFVQGAWRTLPAGFVDSTDPGAARDVDLVQVRRDMREARREEGYADLVGLAWTLTHHSAHYEHVHSWFCRVRDDQPVPGAHHDTRAWLRLVKDPQIYPLRSNLFEQVRDLWQRGLHSPP